ncbi:MAG TPA: hypothetical protein VN420_00660, partial [Candidatus Fimivivens sp.]|nr:hypothetical protein [Candidatus Fimivivens sp.]
WQFVSPHVLPETGNKDFVEQTDILIGNMERLLGDTLPPMFRDAKKKWGTFERSMARTLIKKGKLEAATFFLASCDITRLLREPVQNTFLRYLLVYILTGEKLFVRNHSWSGSPSSDGYLVSFGAAGAGGACVSGDAPDDSYSCLCAVASRSEF